MKSLRRKQSEGKEKKQQQQQQQQQCRTEKEGQCQGFTENEKRGSRGKPADAHRC
jgi:hypothetical protein